VTGDEAIEKSKRSQLPPAAPGHALESAEKSDTLIYVDNKEQTIQRVERGEIKKIPAHGSEVPSHVINDSSVRRCLMPSCR
jgi:rhamnose utilization protein RhaD (predicted bifunctional aldolase and dehydrogenase)